MDHVVIEVRGGVVQRIVSTRKLYNVDFHIIDWDDYSDGVSAPEDVQDFIVDDGEENVGIDPDRFPFEVYC